MEKGRYEIDDAYPDDRDLYRHIRLQLKHIKNKGETMIYYPTAEGSSVCACDVQEAFSTPPLLSSFGLEAFTDGSFNTAAETTTDGSLNNVPDFQPASRLFTKMNSNMSSIIQSLSNYSQHANTYRNMDQNPLLFAEETSVYDVLASDTKQALLFENSLYMAGTVLIASLFVGAVYATAKSSE